MCCPWAPSPRESALSCPLSSAFLVPFLHLEGKGLTHCSEHTFPALMAGLQSPLSPLAAGGGRRGWGITIICRSSLAWPGLCSTTAIPAHLQQPQQCPCGQTMCLSPLLATHCLPWANIQTLDSSRCPWRQSPWTGNERRDLWLPGNQSANYHQLSELTEGSVKENKGKRAGGVWYCRAK